MEASRIKKVEELVRVRGVLRPRDLDAYGIPREYLRRMQDRGIIERIGRGLYVIPGRQVTEHHTLVHVAKRIPGAVFCLLSALRFHDLTTQSPHDVWIAIGPKAWRPRVDGPKIRVFRFSGAALTEGVETHTIEGVTVKVYGVAKTVADCFKFRNKVGLDVALEALRESWRERRASMDDLWLYAKVCRVSNVMRPYLEGLE
jgi:predicted transcriptional regulator of viral defense system